MLDLGRSPKCYIFSAICNSSSSPEWQLTFPTCIWADISMRIFCCTPCNSALHLNWQLDRLLFDQKRDPNWHNFNITETIFKEKMFWRWKKKFEISVFFRDSSWTIWGWTPPKQLQIFHSAGDKRHNSAAKSLNVCCTVRREQCEFKLQLVFELHLIVQYNLKSLVSS